MNQLHIEIFGLGLLAGLVCILLLYKRKKFTSKIIWRYLFLLSFVIFLVYSVDIENGCVQESSLIQDVCVDLKFFPKMILPSIFR